MLAQFKKMSLEIPETEASTYVAALRTKEDQLLIALKTTNILQFSEELFRNRVISKKEKEVFSSIDFKNIDFKLVNRYLIRIVSNNILKDTNVWSKFLCVLSSVGVSGRKVSNILFEEWEKSESRGRSGTAVRNCDIAKSCELHLTDQDIPCLVEALVGISHKWEEIGLSLHLTKHVRKGCKNDKMVLSLSNILSEWVARKPMEATLTKLIEALRGSIVGEEQVALEVQRELQRVNHQLIVNTAFLASAFSISYQTSDTEVADGKSAILEVQPSLTDSVLYQWKKDDSPIFESQAYSGVHSNMLVIVHATQGTEGSYKCCLNKGEEELCSDQIQISVTYSPTKKHLLNLYSKLREVPADSWPPVSSINSFSVSLASYKNPSAATVYDEGKRAMENVAYEEIFGGYESGALVLVEGFPGCGKTTLTHRIAKDWVKGISLKNANIVLLISLRMLCLSKDLTLNDLLDQICRSQKKIRNLLLEEIENSGGEGVCFIIDGLDEYQIENKETFVISSLLHKTYLPLCMVIVTSRPGTSTGLELEAQITKKIEILGFCKQTILDYIENFPFQLTSTKSFSGQQNLKAYLECHNSLLSMCSLPLHATMICFIFEHDKQNIPNTETKLYEQFIRLTVLRYLRTKDNNVYLNSLQELKGKEKKSFKRLCQLALNRTVSAKQVDTPRISWLPVAHDSRITDDNVSFGLVTSDHIAEIAGYRRTSKFFHLTVQEFLAAYYLSKHTEDFQTLKKLCCKPHMLNVLKFYCGLTSLDKTNFLRILYICLENISLRDRFLFAVKLSWESQEDGTCETLLEVAKGIAFDCQLYSSDLAAIEYVLTTATKHIHTICLVQNCTDEKGVKWLFSSIAHNNLKNLVFLTLSCVSLDSDSIQLVTRCLQNCCQLARLDFSQNKLCSNDINLLMLEVKNCGQLTNMSLSYNRIDDDIVGLSEHWKDLNILNLSYNNISSNGIFYLVCNLRKLARVLYLQGNSSVSSEKLLALSDHLKLSSTRIQDLHLSLSDKDDARSRGILKHLEFFFNFHIKEDTNKARRNSFHTFQSHPELKEFNSSFWSTLSQQVLPASNRLHTQRTLKIDGSKPSGVGSFSLPNQLTFKKKITMSIY